MGVQMTSTGSTKAGAQEWMESLISFRVGPHNHTQQKMAEPFTHPHTKVMGTPTRIRQMQYATSLVYL